MTAVDASKRDGYFPARHVGVLHGTIADVAVATPAAGHDWAYVVPGGYWQRIRCGHCTFAASAQASNRYMGIIILSSIGVIWETQGTTPVTAGNTVGVDASIGGTVGVTVQNNVNIQFSLPDIWWPPGYVIETNTTGIQTNDAYTKIHLSFDQIDQDVLQVDHERWAEYHRKLMTAAGV